MRAECQAVRSKQRREVRYLPHEKHPPMKATRKFKNSWFVTAIVVTILVGEIVAWEVSTQLGIRSSPLVVAFVSTGLVAAIVSVLYEGVDIG